eukprot:8312272-Pyramimonas_sp.AAC.1
MVPPLRLEGSLVGGALEHVRPLHLDVEARALEGGVHLEASDGGGDHGDHRLGGGGLVHTHPGVHGERPGQVHGEARVHRDGGGGIGRELERVVARHKERHGALLCREVGRVHRHEPEG